MRKKTDTENKYAYYNSLTTNELNKIINMDFQSTPLDLISPEDMHIILEILVQRDQHSLTPHQFDVNNSWSSFKDDYHIFVEKKSPLYEENNNLIHSVKHYPKSFHYKNIAAILIFLIAIASISQTTIAKNIVSSIAVWSQEIFWFNSSDSSLDSNLSNQIYLDINNAFDFISVPPDLLPAEMPNNLTKVFEDISETNDMKMYYAIYEDNHKKISLNVSIFYLLNDVNIIHEKDNSDIEQYQKDGITYYIMGNLNSNTVIWRNGPFECQIDGTLSREDLKKMIDSIP